MATVVVVVGGAVVGVGGTRGTHIGGGGNGCRGTGTGACTGASGGATGPTATAKITFREEHAFGIGKQSRHGSGNGEGHGSVLGSGQ